MLASTHPIINSHYTLTSCADVGIAGAGKDGAMLSQVSGVTVANFCSDMKIQDQAIAYQVKLYGETAVTLHEKSVHLFRESRHSLQIRYFPESSKGRLT